MRGSALSSLFLSYFSLLQASACHLSSTLSLSFTHLSIYLVMLQAHVMSNPNPPASATSFPTSKRSACDRCRAQKLRCPPRTYASQSCSRCTRLSAYCVTSLTRPLGRNAKARLSARPRSLLSQPERELELRSTSNGPLAASVLGAPSSLPAIPSQPIAVCDERLSMPIDTSTGQDISPLFSPQLLDAFFSDDIQFPSRGDEDEDRGFPDLSDTLSPDYLCIPHISSKTVFEPPMVTLAERPHCISDQPSYVLPCDQRLSRLNLRLSARLEECSLGSKVYDSNLSSCSPSQASTPPEGTEPWSSEALGGVLRDTAEFTNIIGSYSPRMNTSEGEGGHFMGTRLERLDIRPTIGTVVLLDLLSAYLQIVATYDNLFQYLCSRFGTDDLPRLQSLSGIEVAGFHVQHRTLQTRLLLDTILHHLTLMERLLGLPKPWRITDKRKSSEMGLFNDDKTRLILDAVSSSSLEQTGGAVGGHGGLLTVASLRDGIKRLQILID